MKRLLNKQEIDFCLNWVAADCAEDQIGPCFKLAFPESKAITWVKGGRQLLTNPHVVAYIAELREPPTEMAKRRLYEQARDGDGTASLRATERIFELDDKLGARDDAEFWAHVMCEVGAEVEVPMLCARCREENVSVPLKALFPQHVSEP